MSLSGLLSVCVALLMLHISHSVGNSVSTNNPGVGNTYEKGSNVMLTHSGDLHNCTVKLRYESAKGFADQIKNFNYKFIYFTLVFNKDNTSSGLKLNHTNDVIQPGQWIWTYKSPHVPFMCLNLPPDFGVLSLSLLDTYTFRTEMWFEITPADCPLVLGEEATNQAIAQTLHDVMNETKYLEPDIMNDVYWCYLAKKPNISDIWGYSFAINLGQYVQGSEYKCCYIPNPTHGNNNRVKCNTLVPKRLWKECLLVTLLLEILLLIIFPLPLMRSSASMIQTGRTITRPKTDEDIRDGYEEIPSVLLEDTTDTDTESLYFMDGSSPITVFSLFAGVCGLAKHHPVVVSRLRRFLFVVLSPGIIYIKLAMYWLYDHPYTYEQTVAFVDHNIPVSVMSILAGFNKGMYLFMPLLGGPYIFIILYIVLGMLISLIPRDMSVVMAAGISDRTGWVISPLCLDIALVHALAKMHYRNTNGYEKIYMRINAHLCMVCNPYFWTTALKLQIQRWNQFWTRLCTHCGNGSCLLPSICVVLCLPFLVIYTVLCVLELFACLLYYGAPIVYFLITVVCGYNKCLGIALQQYKSRITGKRTRESICCAVIRTFLLIILFVFFFFIFCILFFISFNYIGITSVFVFISALVYPTHTVECVVFVLTIIYYIFLFLSRFGARYAYLLADTINVSLELASNNTETIQTQNNTLFIPSADVTGVRRLKVNTAVIDLTPAQLDILDNDRNDSKNVQYVEYVRNCPGISRKLFDYVVCMYKPIHVEVAKTLLQIVLIMALLIFSAVILAHFSHTTDTSGVLHVLALVAVGILPRVLSAAFVGNTSIEREGFCRRLKATVRNYWSLVAFDKNYISTFDECYMSELY